MLDGDLDLDAFDRFEQTGGTSSGSVVSSSTSHESDSVDSGNNRRTVFISVDGSRSPHAHRTSSSSSRHSSTSVDGASGSGGASVGTHSSGSGGRKTSSTKHTFTSSKIDDDSGAIASGGRVSASRNSFETADVKFRPGSVSRTGVSTWNKTSTITRTNPDGTVVTKVTTSGGVGDPFSDLDVDEEEDPSVDLEDEEESSRRRRRRQAVDGGDPELRKHLGCGLTQCTVIRCQVGPLTTSNRVVFKLRARVWAQTIAEVRNIVFFFSRAEWVFRRPGESGQSRAS